MFVKDIMLVEGAVGAMEQTVVIGKLEADGLLEKTLRGVFLEGREPVLLYPVFLASFCDLLLLVAPLELAGWNPQVEAEKAEDVLHGSFLDFSQGCFSGTLIALP